MRQPPPVRPNGPRRARLLRRATAAAALLPAALSPASAVSWAVDASGTWTTAANWSSDPALPGPADDVTIDRPAGAYTVTLSAAGTQSINSLTSQESLRILNSTLAVATTSRLDGPLTVQGATLSGGIWSAASPGATLSITNNFISTLRSLTLAGPVAISSSDALTVTNGLTLSDNASVGLSGSPSMTFSGAQTLGGAGEIVLDGGSAGLTTPSTSSLTIAPDITVRTGAAGGTLTLGTAGLNRGAIASLALGKNITVSGSSWTNAGAISATNGGSLTLNGSWTNTGTVTLAAGCSATLAGAFTPASLAGFSTAGTNPFYVVGKITATATPLTLSASSPPIALAGGTVIGTIDSPDSTPLQFVHEIAPANWSVLSNATVNVPFTVPAGVGVSAAGAILNRPVTVNGSLQLSGAWANNAGISVSSGGLTLGGAAPASLGAISLSHATLAIGGTGYTTAMIRPYSLADASTLFINSATTLDNSNDTLTLPRPDALAFGFTGTLAGGTLKGPAGSPLTLSSPARFDGVTLASDLALLPGNGALTVAPASSTTIAPDIRLTLDHVAISLQGSSTLAFNNATNRTLDGAGTVTFDSTAINLPTIGGFGTITLAPAITVATGIGGGWIKSVVNNGAIAAQTPGATLILSGVTNNGTLSAAAGGNLRILDTIYNNGTITVGPGSALNLEYTNPQYGLGFSGRIVLAGTLVSAYQSNDPTSHPGPIRERLRAGLGGTTGIIDPAHAADPTHAIGYADASALFDFSSSPGWIPYSGLMVVPNSLVLIPTHFGDANLDGTVDASDYALIDKGFATHANSWSLGDFNYDGAVDSNDYLLIDTTLAQQQGGHLSPAFLSQRESEFGPDYVAQLTAAIPEPALPLSPVLYLLPSFLPRRRIHR